MKGQLVLTWTNKHQNLLSHDDVTYEWVDPSDWRVAEVRLLHDVGAVGDASSGNLLVRGDSLHALTSLSSIPELSKRFLGKVKLCYIDPPFNTGETFQQYDDAVEHSVWLTMLRDRLEQIKRMLHPSGTVWVHLDDSEQHRARAVLDEVFGPENFVTTIVWQKADSPRMDAKQFSSSHDYIHVYSATPGWQPTRYEQTAALKEYPYEEPDGRRFKSSPLRKWGKNSARADRPNLWYPITGPDKNEYWPIKPDGSEGNWRWQESTVERDGHLLHWIDKGSGMQPYVKTYAEQDLKPIPPVSWWPNEAVGHNRAAKAHSKRLFAEAFATPKPEQLIAEILYLGTEPGDLVLDCFAGSGTTAVVAHKMGRRWITSELAENNVDRFVSRRLQAVIAGEDPGGVTLSTNYVFEGDLPDGVDGSAVRAVANRLLDLFEHGTFDDVPGLAEPTVRKMAQALRRAAKVRKVTTSNWSGGGGYLHVEVGPSMFELADDTVVLADWVVGGELARAVAAQLRYRFEPVGPFAGRRGRSRLAVIDGMLTIPVADYLLEQLADTESLLVVAQSLAPDVEKHIADARPGSRAKKVPRDLAHRGKVASHLIRLTSTRNEDHD